MTFQPRRGRLPDAARRCAALTCKVMLKAGELGKYCDTHRRYLMIHGSADTGPLDRPLRRLYIDAVMRRIDPDRTRSGKRLSRAKPLKLSDHQQREMQSTVTDLWQRLQTLPTPQGFHQLGVLPAKDQARQALAWIVKQRGLELATKLILGNAVGADICPKLNSSERYRQTQVAKAVLMLLKYELVPHWATKKPEKKIFPCHGWYMKRELVKWLEQSYFFWAKGIREAIQTELKEETYQRTLELHGVDMRLHKRVTESRAREQTCSSEPRVGTPVDPECPSCLEHGWRFACAIHNTDEERAARWRKP